MLSDPEPPRTVAVNSNSVLTEELTTRHESKEPNTASCKPSKRGCCCFVGGFCFSIALTMLLAMMMFKRGILGLGSTTCTTDPPIITPPPDAVDGLREVSSTITSVSVAWETPSSHNLTILHYEVQSDRTGSGTFLIESSCPPISPRCTLEGLGPSEIVAIRVRAYSSQGPGNFSVPATFTSKPSSAPQTPDNIRMAFQGPNLVAIRWTAVPVCSTQADPTSYKLQYAELQGSTVTVADCSTAANWTAAARTDDDPTFTMQHVTHLLPRRHYCMHVASHNSIGSSPWSEPVLVETSCEHTTAPKPPDAPNASANSDSVLLRWDRPIDDGCADISKYEARCVPSHAAAGARTISNSTKGALLSITLTGLKAKVSYGCQVRAYDVDGPSDWSNATTVTTSAAAPPEPPGAPVTGAGGLARLVTWPASGDDHGSKVTGYELQISNWWVSTTNTTIIYRGGATQYLLSDTDHVLPDSPYTLRVRALNAVGHSAWSNPTILTLDPQGSCGNRADVQIFHDDQSNMRAQVHKAIVGCTASKDKPTCVAGKLHTSAGLSIACGECWGHDAACVHSNCWSHCFANPHSAGCKSCQKAHCTPALLSCAGLPQWAFPPN